MNFAPIAFVDTFDLTASLRTKMGLFKPYGDGLLSIPIRGPRANADDPDDDLAFGTYKHAWVEAKTTISRLKRIGDQLGGADFGRVALQMLKAGATLPWDMESGPYYDRFSRAVLPLRTNPGVMLYSGVESWAPVIGLLTVVNHRVVQSAINLGEHPAIWMSLDFCRKDQA
jgi:hypothetical protein